MVLRGVLSDNGPEFIGWEFRRVIEELELGSSVSVPFASITAPMPAGRISGCSDLSPALQAARFPSQKWPIETNAKSWVPTATFEPTTSTLQFPADAFST